MFVNNECHEDVSLAISYLEGKDTWRNAGFWTIKAKDARRLSSSKGDLLRWSNGVVYFYAKSKTYMWGGDMPEVVGSETVPMQRVKPDRDSDGDWVLKLTY